MNDINYWLTTWLNYYSYILHQKKECIVLISFDDLCNNPLLITKYLNKLIKLDNPISIKGKFVPTPHKEIDFDEELMQKCNIVYEELNSKRRYLE